MNEILNSLPIFIIETSLSGEILFINTSTLAQLEKKEYANIREVLTKGSVIYYETKLMSCFENDTEKTEVFLTLRGVNESIPVLFNLKVSDNKVTFSGISIKNRFEKEKELKAAKELSDKENRVNKQYLDAKKDLLENQLNLEKQLRDLSRINAEQEQVNKVLSHDLQEPIRKILLYTDLLLANSKENTQENLTRISSLAKQSKKLLVNTQRYTSLEGEFVGGQIIEVQPLITKIIQDEFEEKVTAEIENPDNLSIFGDAKQISLMFLELLDNSLQYVKQGELPKAKLRIDTIEKNVFVISKDLYQYQNFVRILYTDNSVGFESQYAEKVFGLFQKLQDSNLPGLGLSYCKKIAELHNGNIAFLHQKDGAFAVEIIFPTSSIA